MSAHYIRIVTQNTDPRIYDCLTLDDARAEARRIVAGDFVDTYAQIYKGRKDERRDADPVEVIE